jgi:hypothetical protein
MKRTSAGGFFGKKDSGEKQGQPSGRTTNPLQAGFSLTKAMGAVPIGAVA